MRDHGRNRLLSGRALRIVRAESGVTLAELINRDGGAVAAAVKLFRDSTSPAASDALFDLQYFGRDDAGNEQQYAGIETIITDPASGSEDGNLRIKTVVAGALVNRVHVGAGLWMEGATGGDPGIGRINATEVRVQGSAVSFTKEYISSNQTITAAGSLTLAHSLGVAPKLVQLWLYCETAQHNYSNADTFPVPVYHSDAGAQYGCSIVADATNLNVRYGSAANTFVVTNKTTGGGSLITNANWRTIFKAWA
jgi:hypothetical protein